MPKFEILASPYPAIRRQVSTSALDNDDMMFQAPMGAIFLRKRRKNVPLIHTWARAL